MHRTSATWSILAALAGAPATLGAAPLDGEGERFKAALVAAYASPSVERLRGLMHPKSAACMSAQPAYETYLMRAETAQPVPLDAKVSVRELAPDEKLPYRGFDFPTRPSHVVRMEYGRKASADGRSATTTVAEKHVAKDGGRWTLVLPCPTPEGLGRLRDMGLLK